MTKPTNPSKDIQHKSPDEFTIMPDRSRRPHEAPIPKLSPREQVQEHLKTDGE